MCYVPSNERIALFLRLTRGTQALEVVVALEDRFIWRNCFMSVPPIPPPPPRFEFPRLFASCVLVVALFSSPSLACSTYIPVREKRGMNPAHCHRNCCVSCIRFRIAFVHRKKNVKQTRYESYDAGEARKQKPIRVLFWMGLQVNRRKLTTFLPASAFAFSAL